MFAFAPSPSVVQQAPLSRRWPRLVESKRSPANVEKWSAPRRSPLAQVHGPLEAIWIDEGGLDDFIDRYQAASGGLTVERSQLLGAPIRGFRVDGVLVGGYRVAPQATRYPRLVGPQRVEQWPFSPLEAAETTHLWMRHDLGPDQRRALYSGLIADLIATGQRYFIGGAVTEATSQQQRRSLPFMLDDCMCNSLGGVNRLRVYYGTVETVLANAIASGIPVPWLAL